MINKLKEVNLKKVHISISADGHAEFGKTADDNYM